MNKAVFLDRDGTINIDTGYIGDPNLVNLYSGVAEGISLLKRNFGFYVIVISNQSGIARGLISELDVKRVNERINNILKVENTSIDAFYFCPHHPDFDTPVKCVCRKPSTFMVNKAVNDFNIDLNKSFFIGDKISDIECGLNAGIKSILITNTISEVELNKLKKSQISPNFITSNFLSAVKFIENNVYGEFVEN